MNDSTKILINIAVERARQDELWGEQNHEPTYWLGILGEEFGEACKAVIEYDLIHAREELVHVAAVAVGFIEYLDRQKDAT